MQQAWYNQLIKNGQYKKLYVNFSDGIEWRQFYSSFGYTKNDGIIDQSGYAKYTATLNFDRKLGRGVDFGISLLGGYSKAEDYAIQTDSLSKGIPMVLDIMDIYE